MFFKKEKNQCSEPTRKGPQKKRVKTAEKDFKKRAKKDGILRGILKKVSILTNTLIYSLFFSFHLLKQHTFISLFNTHYTSFTTTQRSSHFYQI